MLERPARDFELCLWHGVKGSKDPEETRACRLMGQAVVVISRRH